MYRSIQVEDGNRLVARGARGTMRVLARLQADGVADVYDPGLARDWADGVLSAFDAEYAGRVTDREAEFAQAIVSEVAPTEGPRH